MISVLNLSYCNLLRQYSFLTVLLQKEKRMWLGIRLVSLNSLMLPGNVVLIYFIFLTILFLFHIITNQQTWDTSHEIYSQYFSNQNVAQKKCIKCYLCKHLNWKFKSISVNFVLCNNFCLLHIISWPNRPSILGYIQSTQQRSHCTQHPKGASSPLVHSLPNVPGPLLYH